MDGLTTDEELVLLEFKAGKLVLNGTRLAADTRKGLVRLVRSLDGLVRIQWCERQADGSAAEPEDDIIVFPEEATFEKASQTNQRVYLLKFPNETDRNKFFWMQEVDSSEDATLCSNMNELMNTVADMEEDGDEDEMDADAAEAAVRAIAAGSAQPSMAGGPVSQDPKALAAMLSGMLGAGLQQALHQHQAGGAASSSSNPAAATALLAEYAALQQHRKAAAGPSLADILKPEVLAPLLQDPDLLPQLGEHLPDGQQDAEQLLKLAHSAQFQQQLQTFSAALQTGQLDLMQFGLKPKGFSAADFLQAIQDLADQEGSSSKS